MITKLVINKEHFNLSIEIDNSAENGKEACDKIVQEVEKIMSEYCKPKFIELNSDTFQLFLDGKAVINCDSRDKADKLMWMLNLLGKEWRDDTKIDTSIEWEEYKSETYYILSDGYLGYNDLKNSVRIYGKFPIIKL